jgi:hypothetical protein
MINGIILNDQLYIDVACYSLGLHVCQNYT